MVHEEPITPTCWERWMVHHPGLVMIGSFVVAMMVSAGAMANFGELAEGGFEARDSITQRRADAFMMLGGQLDQQDSAANIFYESSTGNMLTEESLKQVCEFERDFYRSEDYFTYCTKEVYTVNETQIEKCMPISSLVTKLFLLDTAESNSYCEPSLFAADEEKVHENAPTNECHFCIETCTLRSDWKTVLAYIADTDLFVAANNDTFTADQMRNEVFKRRKQRALYLDVDFNTDLESRNIKSQQAVSNYDNYIADYFNGQVVDSGLRSGTVLAYYFDDGAFMAQMLQDMALVQLSVIIVFCYMWYNTSSLFLSVCGLFEIIISFPMAFFVWFVILGQGYFNILMMMTLFIILGIGADDIFVLQDAWRQSAHQAPHISGSNETRFAWAYRRASNAMTVTSFTTFCAFVASGMTPVPAIQSFGVFAAFVVLFDYLMVITWFAAALMFHDKYFTPNNKLTGCTKIGIGCDKCLGCIPYSKFAFGGSSHTLCGCCKTFQDEDTSVDVPKANRHRGSLVGIDSAHLGPVESWFYYHTADLNGARYFSLPFFFCLFVVATAVSSSMLRPADTLPDMFPADHPIMKLISIARDRFGQNQEANKLIVHMVWGLDSDDPVDRAGTDMNAATQRGISKFDPYWKHKQVEMQQQMYDVCAAAPDFVPSSSSDLLENGLVAKNGLTGIPETYCLVALLKEFREANGFSFPVECPQGTEFADALQLHNDTLREASRQPDTSCPGDNRDCLSDFGLYVQNYTMGTGSPSAGSWYGTNSINAAIQGRTGNMGISGFVLSEDATYVSAAWIAVNTTVDIPPGRNVPVDEIKIWHGAWTEFLDGQNAPKAFHMQEQLWCWMALVEVLLSSSIKGIVFSLSLALVVLLVATGNLAITCLAMSSILGIMVTVFLTMVALGWQISVLESISMIIVVGMSVDYTVHLMHSYNEAPYESRLQKTQASLTEMGVSVCSGALTTFLAAAPLFSAQLVFFSQFGSFIGMITIYSIVWALFYLMTMASVFGPEDSPSGVGLKWDIPFIKYTMRCTKPPAPTPGVKANTICVAVEDPASAGSAVELTTSGGAGHSNGVVIT